MLSVFKYVVPALLLGGIATTTPSTASAEDAAGPGARAVLAKRAKVAETAEGRAYFQRAHGAPQFTDEGSVIQYFTGDQGDGAIYWSATGGANLLYGALLDHFEETGIDGLGDSLGDPLAGPGDDCSGFDVIRRQAFGQVLIGQGVDVSTVTRWVCLGPKGIYVAPARSSR